MPEQRLEILAPAGDEEMLRAAVFSGADSVYLGVEGFNARRGAANFDGAALARAVAFCHARNCKVYAALNTLVLPGEEARARQAVCAVAQAGCDAVIVQDLGMARLVQKIAPGLPLHASTQMSIHSAAGVRALAELGFERVILARELTLEEIGGIAGAAAQAGMELEVFVHGALCVCVSGQCFMSAFLGGRSANRGSCAGTCRLPFEAHDGQLGRGFAPAREAHHLSMKDLSVLDALPALQQMGVASAKIEGRLRGPEYCAAVVDAALKARAGEEYDRELLRDIFSRSGFTKGWFGGEEGRALFGRRTEQDSEASRAALPKARALYRREMPRVPVDMELVLKPEGGQIRVTDGVHSVCAPIDGPLEEAHKETEPGLRAALGKTGGTPFYARKLRLETAGLFAPAGAVGALRRELLEQLLQLRGLPPEGRECASPEDAPEDAGRPAGERREERPLLLRARFERVEQLPQDAETLCGQFLLPLFEAEKVPEKLRHKTWLWLPRVLFGEAERRAAQAVEKTREMGFLGYEVQNPAHWALCRGLPMSGGFGLNIADADAAAVALRAGVRVQTLSPELTLRQMREIVQRRAAWRDESAFDMLVYGRLPLMVTRACPLRHVAECENCGRCGSLTDRKGASFAVLCREGVRSIHNPVPLWMGDRLAELPTPVATLYFTTETKEEAKAVLQRFGQGKAAAGDFTRGLYYKGVTDI